MYHHVHTLFMVYIRHMGEHLGTGNKLLVGNYSKGHQKHGDHSPGGHGTRYHRALCRFAGTAVGT